ncbi:MAG: PorT family protein, partial [Bacteroidetes bacterium]|nr:PorT family protein [Bacteroidota bacterium]
GYLDIPLEIRYKSKNDFRLAVGFKFGFLLRAHTKYKGDDYLADNPDDVVYKKSKLSFLEKNRYGFTARIGYKWLNLWGYYQLSTLFQKDYGPEMYPVSVGITIIPF